MKEFYQLRTKQIVLSSFAASLMGWACPAMANTATMDAMTMTQQNGIVKGVVKDAKGEPIIGATIKVKNATNATVTDLNGNFTLGNVSRGTLLISYVGYLNKEVEFRSGQTLNITLAENTDASMPRMGGEYNNTYSSFWLTSGDYLRLKSLELGYTFRNNATLAKLGVQSLRLYLAGSNLLTFTSLDDYDPEKSGTDTRNDVHPNIRSYSFGINVKF